MSWMNFSAHYLLPQHNFYYNIIIDIMQTKEVRPMAFHHINFKCDVTPSNTLTGAGPNPKTVLLPAAICVLPASSTKYSGIPACTALSKIRLISSSFGHLTAIFAHPVLSHADSADGHCLWARL
jgi:hypothetical protein